MVSLNYGLSSPFGGNTEILSPQEEIPLLQVGLTPETIYTLYAYLNREGYVSSLLSSEIFETPVLQGVQATGGNISYYEDTEENKFYKIHTFTNLGESEFKIQDNPNNTSIDVLIVAGGGGGACVKNHSSGGCGGGGAGGLIFIPDFEAEIKSYNVIVGAGGEKGNQSIGSNGQNSSFNNLVALGGGGGQNTSFNNLGLNGGSGGGMGTSGPAAGTGGLGLQSLQSGLSGEFGFGNHGGDSIGASRSGSGGGGAGENGEVHTSSFAGKGGDGLYFGNKFGENLGENG